jgi:Tfp pilus assembly protein PilO
MMRWLIVAAVAVALAPGAAPAQDETEKLRKELADLRRERDALKEAVQKRDAEIAALTQEKLRFRDMAEKFELAYKSARNQIQGLLAQLSDVALSDAVRELQEMRKKVVPPAPALPQQANGRITRIDPTFPLAVINLGSDAGLKNGMKLEVFRLADDVKEARYLGELVVIEVRPTEAIGRFELASKRGEIKVGDQVGGLPSAGTPGKRP